MQEVGTKATGPRSIFAKTFAQMKTSAEVEAHGAVNMTADKRVQFLICPADAEIEAITWGINDTDRIVNQLDRDVWYHLQRPDAVHERILHQFGWV